MKGTVLGRNAQISETQANRKYLKRQENKTETTKGIKLNEEHKE